jgi:hypothetical protein
MFSLNFWIAFVAAVSAILGAIVTLKPPQTSRYKILAFVGFVVLCVVGLALVAVQSKQQADAEKEAAEAQQQLQSKLAEVKTLLQQPNPDRGEIISRLDKLTGKQDQTPVAVPPTSMPTPAETAYSRLTNGELKKEVAGFIPQLEEFAKRRRRHLQEAMGRGDYTESGREIDSEYQTKFRAKAVTLRDEMLRRLPPQDQSRLSIYESLAGPSPIEDIITDLQRLSILLS